MPHLRIGDKFGNVLVGDTVVYLDETCVYPYPRVGNIEAIPSDRHVIIHGRVKHITDVYGDITDKDFIRHRLDVIKARIKEMAKLYKEVKSQL